MATSDTGLTVKITNFVNPHLFWIIDSQQEDKCKELEKRLEDCIRYLPEENHPRVGQHVAVYNCRWKRAIVKDLNSDYNTFWLMDYGCMLTSPSAVFKLPDELTLIEPTVSQAVLKDVVCVKQLLMALEMVTKPVTVFSPGSIKCFKERLQEAKEVSFKFLEKRNDILLGELYFKNANEIWYNVAQALADEEILTFNKKIFEIAFVENTKTENAFRQTSFENTKNLNKLLDVLEEYHPLEGRGRGISFSHNSNLKKPISPGISFKENREDFDSNSSSGIQEADACNMSQKAKTARMKALQRLQQLSAENSKRLSETENVNELHISKDSDVEFNLSNVSDTSQSSEMSGTKRLHEIKNTSQNLDNTKQINWNDYNSTSLDEDDKITTTKDEFLAKVAEIEKNAASSDMLSSTSSFASKYSDCNNRRKCKGACNCETCQGWFSNEVYYANKKGFVGEDKKKKKVIQKPMLLLKSSTENVLDSKHMKSYADIVASKSKVEISCMPKILAHCRSFPTPVTSIASVAFHPEIRRAMCNFEQVYTIQSYVWPSLMRCMNVCMVNPPKSGKTFGYLPVVLSFLLDKKDRYVDLPKNSLGPISIILCSRIKMAEEIYFLTCKLLDHAKFKPTFALAVPPLDKKCLAQFYKSCDLLITTPPLLLSLLSSRIIEIQRLCHLVIENCDQILHKFSDDMNLILNLIQTMLSNRLYNYPIQLITTAECWTPSLENFIKRIESVPNVYIGSFLEAALYGRADLKLNFVQSRNKRVVLINTLENLWKTNRTIVLFNRNCEIDEVKEHLEVHGVEILCIYEFTQKSDVLEMEERWENTIAGNHKVLLCIDQVYNNTLTISQASILVHYSFPNTWTQFVQRFGCLINSYESPLVVNNSINRPIQSQVHIFVDENCDQQFSRILKLFVRMGAKMTDKYCNFYQKVMDSHEQENIQNKVNLCDNVKLFGECHSYVQDPSTITNHSAAINFASRLCTRRHILSQELDEPSEWKSGYITYKVMGVKNVTCLAVKLLEFTDSEGKKHTIETDENLEVKLKKTMMECKNCVGNAKLGNLCVYISQVDDSCERCVVLKINKVETITKRPILVTVRFLDSGKEARVSTVDLYEMPAKFKQIPSQVIDVFIANLIPPHFDDSWSNSSRKTVEDLLSKAEYNKEPVFGNSQILLHLGNIFWVKNVLLMEKLAMSNLTVLRLNLKKELLDAELVSVLDNQLTKLYALCTNAKMVLPDYNKVCHPVQPETKVVEVQATPQWAYLDNEDSNHIYFTCIESPNLFYVRQKKFDDLLVALQKDIQKAIEKPLFRNEFTVEVGKFYLAQDPESDDFCRVQVKSIEGDIVNCFYVDYGDCSRAKKSALKFLPNHFITKLPFQAIECCFYGIFPTLGKWEPNATHVMDRYIFEPETTVFRTLYCKVCNTEEATSTGGKNFSVLIGDYLTKKFLNQLLIDLGEAIEVVNEKLDLSISLTLNKSENMEEEIGEDEMFEDASGKNAPILSEFLENDSFDDDDCYLFTVENPEQLLFEATGLRIPQRHAIDAAPQPQLPQMTALPPSGYFTPSVVWYQTSTHVKLKIKLVGVDTYDLRIVRQKIFSFKTTCNEKHYELHLQLFDKVMKNAESTKCGLYIEVILEKCVPTEWPRLLHSSETMRNLTYDFSKCEVDEEKPRKRILDLGAEIGDELVIDDEFIAEYQNESELGDSDLDSLSS